MRKEELFDGLTAECGDQTAAQLASYWPDEERENWVYPDQIFLKRMLREFDTVDGYAQRMLVGLLASASLPKRANRIHPAFLAVIPQLSEEDCEILKDLSVNPIAVLDCMIGLVSTHKCGLLTRESVTSERVEPLIPLLTARTPKNGDLLTLQICLENLLRLGLAERRMNPTLQEPSQVNDDAVETIYLMYEELIGQTAEHYRSSHPLQRDAVCYLRTGQLVLSTMGRRFVRYCLM